MQIQAQSCKYKPRHGNTSPAVHTQFQLHKAKTTKPAAQIQAPSCTSNPRLVNTTPDLRLQGQSCKYKPRLANTSPGIQVQAQTFKSKTRPANTTPGLQIRSQTCKYKPRPANTISLIPKLLSKLELAYQQWVSTPSAGLYLTSTQARDQSPSIDAL